MAATRKKTEKKVAKGVVSRNPLAAVFFGLAGIGADITGARPLYSECVLLDDYVLVDKSGQKFYLV